MPASDPAAPIADYFADLGDPRRQGSIDYPLHEIVVLTICAVICGADGFTAIESFGEAKRGWLGRFLELKNGIASHDTIGRLFKLIDPEAFERCFLRWVESACERIDGEVVAIDGKTLRRSYDCHSGKAALHMVSAWAAENRLALGQVKTSEQSNEITALPKLLQMLDLSGCIVTIDAMGCQKDIAEAITDQGADYVLALKGNQGELLADAEALFDRLDAHEGLYKSPGYKRTSGGHGRVEVRSCQAVEVAGRGVLDAEGWPGLRTVCRVESKRHVGGKTSTQTRYFVSSLEADAEKMLKAVRTHWHIENKMHWVLDVAFGEDQSRVRTGHAAENMAVVKRLALNLLKREDTLSVGFKNKRLRAGWDHDYLLKVLQQV